MQPLLSLCLDRSVKDFFRLYAASSRCTLPQSRTCLEYRRKRTLPAGYAAFSAISALKSASV